MSGYGRITHHLSTALDKLDARKPLSKAEQQLHTEARYHLLACLLLVRRIHHKVHLWKEDRNG